MRGQNYFSVRFCKSLNIYTLRADSYEGDRIFPYETVNEWNVELFKAKIDDPAKSPFTHSCCPFWDSWNTSLNFKNSA